MKFCSVCHMLMLISSKEDAPAQLLCPNCKHAESIDAGTHVVRERTPKDRSALYKRYMTPDLVKDPTLPRASGVQCPFCEAKEDIVYVKYDKHDLGYVYACAGCDKFWTNAAAVSQAS